jgi:hypothetical protein
MTLSVFIFSAGVFLVALLAGRYIGRRDSSDANQGLWVRGLIPAAIAGILSCIGLWLIAPFLPLQFLTAPNENAAAESSIWTSLSYFVTMVLGMMAQTLWQAIKQRKKHQPPTLDKWEFVKPALVAPIVFVAVYHNISESHVTAIMLLFSFQNGFFWQTVLRK